MFKELNKTVRFSSAIDVDVKVEYKSLKDFENGKKLNPIGFYINSKSEFGEQPNMILKGNVVVNLPSHQLKAVQQILESDEMCEAVESGKLEVEVYSYDSKRRKNCKAVKFLDKEVF